MGMSQLRVGVVGLGPIGIELVRAVLVRRELQLVAVADISLSLAGKPLAELVPGASPDLIIDGALDLALARRR
jgi:hypothetical protein